MAAAKEKDSPEAQAVRRWKQPEAKRAGDFAAVLKDVRPGGCQAGFGPLEGWWAGACRHAGGVPLCRNADTWAQWADAQALRHAS